MYKYIKRFFDILLGFFAIIAFSWLFIIIAILIKIEDKGPILFKQRRIGKGKKEFYILKFRSMKMDTPKNMPTHLLENPDLYITKVGKFLRKSSLDELPQLFNILKGDMSIVGPRPALFNQYDLIEKRDLYGANDILPGLTGLAQIMGRDELEIDKKAFYDGEYKEKMSFLFDVLIILKTFVAVFKAEGVKEGRRWTLF